MQMDLLTGTIVKPFNLEDESTLRRFRHFEVEFRSEQDDVETEGRNLAMKV
jgi:hypothetical protein